MSNMRAFFIFAVPPKQELLFPTLVCLLHTLSAVRAPLSSSADETDSPSTRLTEVSQTTKLTRSTDAQKDEQTTSRSVGAVMCSVSDQSPLFWFESNYTIRLMTVSVQALLD
eukprot:Selendium_serpulae@DN5467_c0_g1_i9.p1